MTTIKAKTQSIKGLLQNLRANTAGNTMAMAAAALFPIAGLIGGGVDIGRAYMAQARLQQACDAGALAARRNMTQDTLTTADRAEATKFFEFNFPEGIFSSTDFDATVLNDDGTIASTNTISFVDGTDPRVVVGTAQTTIDTSLMQIFGYENMVISANCSSRLDVGNVDIMMVLDVTGSMGETVTDGGTRLGALQDAVEVFYGILGPGGGTSGEQVRYGFVPYTSTTNVGEILFDEDPTWLVGGTAGDRWTYQTRRSTWDTTTPDLGNPKTSDDVVIFETFTEMDGPECVNGFGNNEGVPGWFNPSPSGNPLTSTAIVGSETIITTITHEYDAWDANDNGNFEAGEAALPPPGAVGSTFWNRCRRMVTTNTSVYDTPVPTTVDVWEPGATNFAGWEYGQFTHDVSGYVRSIDPNNPRVQRPTWNGLQLDRWQGCIEERNSVHISATDTAIPAGSLDMDIDLLPTDVASRWRPHWREIVYDPNTQDRVRFTNGFAPCPTESRRLTEYPSYDDGTTNDLQSYIDSFTANGGTNHTIGMLWGARLLSADGLFATENSASTNGFSIGRHIVFMTDGLLDVRPENYGSFNINEFIGKIAPVSETELQLEARQAQRFQLLCTAVKVKGWTIWVVQFGVPTVTANMENCASSPDHATAATDSASLVEAFSDIAQSIGGLRLDN